MIRFMNAVSFTGALCLILTCTRSGRTPASEMDPTSMLLLKAETYLPENLYTARADSSIELDFRQLIAKGAKVDSVDEDSNTALLLLARTTDKRYFSKVAALADILLENKADVNGKDPNQRTALHTACVNGNKPLAELLLARGADINARDQSFCTPVVYAVLGNFVEIVDLLARQNADLTWKDPTDSLSLLEIAERRNYAKIAEVLKTSMNAK